MLVDDEVFVEAFLVKVKLYDWTIDVIPREGNPKCDEENLVLTTLSYPYYVVCSMFTVK
jgi:hypothetical protein